MALKTTSQWSILWQLKKCLWKLRSKNIPARDPKQCGGSGRIINVDDDDDDDDDDVEDDDVEEEDRSQDLGPHFARACAIEMHVNISQEPLYYRNLQGKMPWPRTAAHTLCEPVQSKCTSTFHESQFIRKFTEKMPRPRAAVHTLREPAQSKCTSTFHKSHGHFKRKFTGKRPAGAPWSSPGLYNYRKNPSVWTHCLGNYIYI